MLTKKELINKRIENLFGVVGYEKGQFYYDNYYRGVYQIVNEGGGVRCIIRTGTPKQTLEILDAIQEYKYFEQYKKENMGA